VTILTVTLNAAIDKRYDVPEITVGHVQRVTRVLASAGGKGLNVSRSALLCGQSVIATGFVAGFAGQFVTSEVSAAGMRDEFVRVAGETRTCINIIDSTGRSTEFLEPGVTVTPDDLSVLIRRITDLLPSVEAVTLSGSAPAGCPQDVYAPLVRAAVASGMPVLLDTSGALLAAGIAAGPTVVKPNQEELAALVGAQLISREDIVAAARRVCAQGPEWVVVSLGAGGAVAVSLHRAVHVAASPVTALNTVGCGDVLVGGLATGLASGLDVADALPLAVRVSAAAAAHPETGVFDPAFAAGLETHVTVINI
jgi:tagatose 6-phosphate kinase